MLVARIHLAPVYLATPAVAKSLLSINRFDYVRIVFGG
jgi:hypothetical protein